MPRNKETNAKNMLRLTRSLYGDAARYSEVAQKAHGSQTDGDQDDATWRRDVLSDLADEAARCIDAAEKKGLECSQLKEALIHARSALDNPPTKESHQRTPNAPSTSPTDKDNTNATSFPDDAESLVTRSYCSGSPNNQSESLLDSDEDADPRHDSTPPLICSAPTNKRSVNQLKLKPTKSDRGQTAGESEFINRCLPTKDLVNFGPDLSTSAHQPTQRSGEKTTQLPTQESFRLTCCDFCLLFCFIFV